MLFIGETGVGKTYIAKTLARILAVPLLTVDATYFTSEGYAGDSVKSIPLSL